MTPLVFVPFPSVRVALAVEPLAPAEPEGLAFVPPAVVCAEPPLLLELPPELLFEPPLLVPPLDWVTGGLIVG